MAALAGTLLDHLRRLAAPAAFRAAADEELLSRFVEHHDQLAFSTLVARHGPMVMNVCRRVLVQAQAAEDAFQATFLVLARRCKSVRRRQSLPAWLYGVAYRISLNARRTAARKPTHQSLPNDSQLIDARPDPLAELTARELLTVLEEEVQRLPKEYRLAVVLCCLDGMGQREAAHRLHCTEATLRGRLERGRARLHARLVGRGLTLSAGLGVLEAARGLVNAAPAKSLLAKTAKAGLAYAGSREAALAQVSAEVMHLAQYGMKATAMLNLKLLLVAAFMAGVAALGAGGLGDSSGGLARTPKESEKKAMVAARQNQPKPKNAGPRLDLYGDPLPDGAVARLGTVRFRHDSQVNQVAYSPDGKIMASAGGQGIGVCIWDAATGIPLHRLAGIGLIGSLAFSPDGKTIFTDHLHLIDVATGKELRRLKLSGGGLHVTAVAFSPDGQTVAAAERYVAGGKDSNDLVVWDAATGKELRILKGHTSPARCLAYSPDGVSLASAGVDKTIRIWQVATGQQLRQFDGHNDVVSSIIFSPDGKILASASNDQVIRLWDVQTGNLMHGLNVEEKEVYTVAFSPDGKLLVSGGLGGMLSLWDVATAKQVRQWQAHHSYVYSLAFSPDGKVVASTGSSSSILRWEAATGKAIDPVSGHASRIRSLQFAADNKTLFSRAGDSEVLSWDITTARVGRQLFDAALAKQGVEESRIVMSVSPDGKSLALQVQPTLQDKSAHDICLWDAAQAKERCTLNGHVQEIGSAKFSPDDKVLASCGGDGLRLWDVVTGKQLHHIPMQNGDRQMLAFSPDGQILAVTAHDKTIGLWNTAAGKEIRRWDSKIKYRFQALVFSPDGKSITGLGLEPGEFRTWDVTTGKEVTRLDAEEGYFAISPSGRVMAVATKKVEQLGGFDLRITSSQIQLWETFSGKKIGHFDENWLSPLSLAISPDGRTLATGGGDSTIMLWDLTGHARIDKSAAAPLGANELESHWSDLAADAANADKAIWALALAAEQSMQLLKKHMMIAPAPAEQVAKLISDLNSDSFATRQKAAQALEKLSESAEAQVRKHLERNITLEVRQRLQQFLDNRNKDAIRKLRALEVLEQIGTAEARLLLETLAKESPNPRVALAASAALARLAKRG